MLFLIVVQCVGLPILIREYVSLAGLIHRRDNSRSFVGTAHFSVVVMRWSAGRMSSLIGCHRRRDIVATLVLI